jgi:hypothetical protein
LPPLFISLTCCKPIAYGHLESSPIYLEEISALGGFLLHLRMITKILTGLPGKNVEVWFDRTCQISLCGKCEGGHERHLGIGYEGMNLWIEEREAGETMLGEW